MVLATANPDKARGDRRPRGRHRRGPGRARGPARLGGARWRRPGTPSRTTPGSRRVALVEATGLPAIADDTGLEVDALGGAPGVFSARFAGEHATYADNVAKLLAELDACRRPASPRPAGPGSAPWPWPASPAGGEVVAHGVVEGTIADGTGGAAAASATTPSSSPTAATGGPTPRCAAEKNARSHRARAFRALAVGLLSG